MTIFRHCIAEILLSKLEKGYRENQGIFKVKSHENHGKSGKNLAQQLEHKQFPKGTKPGVRKG